MATAGQPTSPNPQAQSETATLPPAGVVAEPPTLPPSVPGDALTLPPPPAISDSETLPPTDSIAAAGTVASVPGYEIIRELGRGGMGVVYQARQTKLGRVVALKMILTGAHAGPDDLARFRTEAEAIACLQHPNIVQIYEVGQHGGLPFFSLEFCGGGSLEGKRGGRPLPPKDAAALVETLARAMQAAHDKGVIHRDLKPANVLLAEDGTPKVTDFGLAKKLDEAGRTASGAVMGTPSYMAPEQAGGKAVGPAADVYALGAILYECLTGRPPFKAATNLDTILQVVSEEPVSPARLQPKTPRDLETICLKCLQKDPARRYESAAGLADDLSRCRRGEPIRARQVGLLERALKWGRRNPVVAGLGALVFLTLVLGTTVALYFAVQADRRAEAEAEANRGAQEARRDAEAAGQRASGEAERVKKEQQATREQLGRAEALLYAGRLALAQQQYEKGNVTEALAALEECRWDFRRWEHAHLLRLCSGSQLTLRGHARDVSDVAFSPDGKQLASAAYDGSVRVWDAADGREVRSLWGRPDAVAHGVAYGPGGKRLAAVGGVLDRQKKAFVRGQLTVWDPADGKTIFDSPEYPLTFWRVAYSPDGKHLAAAGDDGTVRVWDSDGREVFRLEGHKAPATNVAFSPDGRRLASSSWDQTARVWGVDSGKELFACVHSAPVFAVAFSPDGKRLATGTGDPRIRRDRTRQVYVWDAHTGEELEQWPAHGETVSALAFSPDGKRLASAGRDRKVKVWNAATGEQLLHLEGHTDEVLGAAFSPDGKRLASASRDRTVKVWDTTAQPYLALRAAGGVVSAVAFSPDGRRLAAVNMGGFRPADLTLINPGGLAVWEPGRGAEASLAWQRPGLFFCAAFSPGGEHLVAAGADWDQQKKQYVGAHLKVWDAASGQEIRALQGHEGPVRAVAFRPDGARLASAGDDGTVRVWDPGTGREILQLKGEGNPVRGVAFSPDGKRLASAGTDNAVRVWDAANGQQLHCLRGHADIVWAVAFSPDGTRLASASDDRTVRVWDAATGEPQLVLEGHTRGVKGLAFSPDGERLVSAGEDELIKVWDVTTGVELLTLKGHTLAVNSVAFTPDGRRLASGGNDAWVRVWDAGAGREPRTLRRENYLSTVVAFSPDGKLLASPGGVYDRPRQKWAGGEVTVWDANTGRKAFTLRGHEGYVQALAFHPGGRYLATGGADRAVKVWDLAARRDVLTLTGHADEVLGVAFSPDGTRLASGSADRQVKVWDVASGAALLTLPGHAGKVTAVAFSPDGRRLASTSGDPDQPGSEPEVKVWDAATGATVFTATGHRFAVVGAAFAPDGRALATGARDGTVKLWDADTGREIATLRGGGRPVLAVAFAGDGRRLASANGLFDARWGEWVAGDIMLWDVATRRQVLTLRGHTGAIWSVAFSPDGRRLASASSDRTVKVWDVEGAD